MIEKMLENRNECIKPTIVVNISPINNWYNGLAHELIQEARKKYGTIRISSLREEDMRKVREEYVRKRGERPSIEAEREYFRGLSNK